MALENSPLFLEQTIGGTPLVRLRRFGQQWNQIFTKMELFNPAGSSKDRPALAMLLDAEEAGVIRPGDTIIECTNGNTGVAVAMLCAARGYKFTVLLPKGMTEERTCTLEAYGAEIIDVTSLEEGRLVGAKMARDGKGYFLDQNNNQSNTFAHFNGTGKEIWEQSGGKVTHFIACMGTSGTLVGIAHHLKSKNPDVEIIGIEPSAEEATFIPGIRKWPEEFRPSIRDDSVIDRIMTVTRREAEETARVLAKTEGILAGVSSGAAMSAALRLSLEVENAYVVVLLCDRGERYLSTGLFSNAAFAADPAACPVEELPSALQRMFAYPGSHFVLLEHSSQQNYKLQTLLHKITAAVKKQGGTLLHAHGKFPSNMSFKKMFGEYFEARPVEGPVLIQFCPTSFQALAFFQLNQLSTSHEVEQKLTHVLHECACTATLKA